MDTATFRLLFVFIALHHERRQIAHFGVTANPTATWVVQQITEAFPWDTSPRYMIRDRDSMYGSVVRARAKVMGIEEVVTARRSPWQNPFVERAMGSIRRECLDHVIVLNERHLRRVLASYVNYYHRSRTHLSLGEDTPVEGRSSRPTGGRSSPFPRSVACIIVTSGGQPDQAFLSLTVEAGAASSADENSFPRRSGASRRRSTHLPSSRRWHSVHA